jgi:hypothetical protein
MFMSGVLSLGQDRSGKQHRLETLVTGLVQCLLKAEQNRYTRTTILRLAAAQQ